MNVSYCVSITSFLILSFTNLFSQNHPIFSQESSLIYDLISPSQKQWGGVVTNSTTVDPPILTDVQFCGTSENVLELPESQNIYVWWLDSLSSDILTFGDQAILSPTPDQTDTTFFISLAEKVSEGGIGIPTMNSGIYSNFPRGLRFNVFESTVIDSVSVFADSPMDMTILVKDASGNIVASKEVNVPNGGGQKSVIPVGFQISPGFNYTLETANMIGGNLFLENDGVAYPYTISDLISITSSSPGFSVIYYYFYDLKVSSLDLDNASERTSLKVDFLPSPEVDLGRDSVVCGDDYLISVPDQGATYSWNTGASTNELLVTESGSFTLTANIGQCVTSDSVEITLLGAPPEPILNDTTVCTSDQHIISIPENGFGYTWWRTQDSEIPFAFESQITEEISDTTVFYVESTKANFEGIAGIPTLENAGYAAAPRGLVFNTDKLIRIDTVDLYVTADGMVTIELWNAQDSVLLSKEVSVESNLPGPSQASLGFIVPQGT
ncbi:MAG: hypothetical protein AAGC85_23660, partial [Bacteroidota bacterium]